MKIVTSNKKTTVKMSKSEWVQIGKTAGWGDTDTMEVGCTPNAENCSQVGAREYDYFNLNKMEVQAYIGQLRRMFPDIPENCRFVTVHNNHEFGTYYDVGVKYRSDDEQAADYAFRVESGSPEYWDDQAMAELEKQGYFKYIKKAPR